MSKQQTFETQWGGKTLSISVGKFANQANGSCLVQYGETVVMATATMSSEEREGLDFFPLMVDFEEKMYASGRIKGSRFIKREGRPTDEAVLTSRFVDRAIRPLFDSRMRNDIQVITTCLAFDEENDPDIVALIAASCALHISDIPWNGPIADIRIGQIEGEWIINPSYEARKKSILDLAFAGTPDTVIMVEAGAKEAPENVVLEAFWFGQKHLVAPIKLIEDVRTAVGKEKLDPFTPQTEQEKADKEKQERIEEMVIPFVKEQVQELFFGAPQATKVERTAQKKELKKRTKVFLVEQGIADEDIHHGTSIVNDLLEEEVSRMIIEEEKRVDGRAITEIRELVAETDLLPQVHGSGHFSRGETQVLSVVTLGAPGDEQLLDGMEVVGKKRYFHHYNFPPYSVGETKPMRGPSRRDIGHGALAEKALLAVLPDKESFPYTIQVVSEVLSSNGSSSMAATCGSTLSLMAAGVPISNPVAGMAMGLASDKNGNWKVITDLQDLEDGVGGMDFKITGTKNGVTAIQMDTKTSGLSKEIVEQTFHQAKDARNEALDKITSVIAEPRPELSPNAPRIITLRIEPEQIGSVIGPAGKTINEIIDVTGVTAIDIEDDGLVMITSKDAEGAKKAHEWIHNLTRTVEAGEIFKGKVTRLMDFGAFVEVLPKQEGLVHISELAPYRVATVGDIVKVGDEVMVKVKEIDDMGRINLSMKDAPGNTYPEKPPTPPQNNRKPGGFNPRGNNGRPKPPSRPRP